MRIPKLYIIHAEKQMGIVMESIVHLSAKSKKKAKKYFKEQYKGWKIVKIVKPENNGQ